MSLIRDIDTLPRKRALVESMIRVCQRDLDIQVVCEGVETPAERDVLIELEASLLQGYLFARPQQGFCQLLSSQDLPSQIAFEAQAPPPP
jgi:EAL domain-containing protein (putative c-di-GMP-specific phosphodiesterase class I)